MKQEIEKKFTKYEIARVIGARALQIAMDAPLLLKLSEDELKEMQYDALKIAEREFESGALPITINRPLPRKRREKSLQVKEEEISDAELIAKEKEAEKEIVANPQEYSIVQADTEEAEEVVSGEEQ